MNHSRDVDVPVTTRSEECVVCALHANKTLDDDVSLALNPCDFTLRGTRHEATCSLDLGNTSAYNARLLVLVLLHFMGPKLTSAGPLVMAAKFGRVWKTLVEWFEAKATEVREQTRYVRRQAVRRARFVSGDLDRTHEKDWVKESEPAHKCRRARHSGRDLADGEIH